jgi:hypothetical protein
VSDGPSRKSTIAWRDINLEEGRYRARVFPASAFPTNPAAKIQMMQEMLAAGVIDQQSFYELALDVPDLESVRNRIVAPIELLHKRIGKMLVDGDYLPPEPTMDLQLAVRETTLAIQRAELEDVPEERVELLRQFLSHVLMLQQAAMAPPPAPPPVEGAPGMPAEAMPPMPPEMMGLPPMPPGPPGMPS